MSPPHPKAVQAHIKKTVYKSAGLMSVTSVELREVLIIDSSSAA
jgi:hypothetical protein